MNKTLIARSRATPWGSAVALGFALLFAAVAAATLNSDIVPDRLGVFVAPPPWLLTAVLGAFALFLFMVGIAELARFIKPTVEVVVDDAGVSTFGLLGRRRIAWGDVARVSMAHGVLTIDGVPRGNGRSPRLRISATRLDTSPRSLVSALLRHRPDLDIPWDWSLEPSVEG